MLTLNSNVLKIGNRWLLPVNSGGVVPPTPGEIVSYVLRIWNSHDRRVCFQKLKLTDQDPTTVDYSVLPPGNRPTQSPVVYVPPLITSVKAYTLGSNTSYDMSGQIQEYANGGLMDTGTYGTIRTAWEDKRYEGYVDMEFTWPYSFPIISNATLSVYNGFEIYLYGILDNGHYVQLAYRREGNSVEAFPIDTSTVYDVTTYGQGTVSLWPSAGNEGDQLAIHWEPPSGYSLSGFTVNGYGASESSNILTVGTEDITLTPTYDIYGDYDRYELEITTSPSGAIYFNNMNNPTPVSGTYTVSNGTFNMDTYDLAAITGNGQGGNLYGSEVIKYTLAFGSTAGPYIHWKSMVAANDAYPTNVYTVDRIATAKLYGWKFGIKYPLGTTKFKQSQVENEYKVSTCRNMNIPVYSVTTSGTNGSLSASPAGGMAGTQVTLIPTADSGYVFDSYTITSGTGASISGNTLTIGTSDVYVTANFTTPSYAQYRLSLEYTSDTSTNGAVFLRAGMVNGSTSPAALSGTGYDSWGTTSSLTHLNIGSTSWSNSDLGGIFYGNKIDFLLDMNNEPSSMSFMVYDVGSHICKARFYGVTANNVEVTLKEWTGLANQDTFSYP